MIFQRARHSLPGKASGVLCAAAETLIPVLRSPKGYLQKAGAAPLLEVAKQGTGKEQG